MAWSVTLAQSTNTGIRKNQAVAWAGGLTHHCQKRWFCICVMISVRLLLLLLAFMPFSLGAQRRLAPPCCVMVAHPLQPIGPACPNMQQAVPLAFCCPSLPFPPAIMPAAEEEAASVKVAVPVMTIWQRL